MKERERERERRRNMYRRNEKKKFQVTLPFKFSKNRL